jgi:glycosyltransferase involved in cell wall biosynthesis
MKPFFSGVVTAFNREFFVGRCIDSILNQELKNWEAVFVDDGSADKFRKAILSYNHHR